MGKDNKKTELDNTDEKLHISDVSIEVCYCGHILEPMDYMEGFCCECGLPTPLQT